MLPLAKFKGKCGIVDFWPFAGPQVDDEGDGLVFRAKPNTFLFAQSPMELVHITPAVRTQLTTAGYDFVRIQYHPGVFMQGIAQNDPDYLAYLFGLYDNAIHSLVDNGIGVVLSAIPTGFANIYTPADILGGIDSADWALYKQHLTLIGTRYANIDPTLLAIEAYNEPPGNGTTTVRPNPPGGPNWSPQYTGDWATQYQPEAYALLRSVMPHTTIILTSDGWSNWETLTQIDPTQYLHDDNLMWTFHPLFPVPACEQGYPYNQYQYIQGLNYPPAIHGQTSASEIAKMTAIVNATNLSAPDKASTIAGLANDLEFYFNTPQDYNWILGCFVAVRDWARSFGIPPGNCFAGEYGMVRDNTGFPGNILGQSAGYMGGTRLDRIHLYADCSRAAQAVGMPYSPDHLDTLDFGFTTAQNNSIGPFDPLIQKAVNPFGANRAAF